VAVTAPPSPVGALLRAWRTRRNLSQLELALNAEVSARHVSFLETGRSRPSREMVIRLAEELEIPLRERNSLMLAAGYAPVYAERPLEAPEMEPVRQALDRFLRAHEPYPAVVVDRYHNLIAANDALDLLLEGVAPELLEPPANGMRVALHPDGMAPRTLNLGEWSAHLLHRVRREAQISGDPQLAELYDELTAYPGVQVAVPNADVQPCDIVLPLRLLDTDGTGELAFFSTLSTFGTAADITLSELAIEAFYPANAPTAMRLMREVTPGVD
jgi:transcriptional regulator with XRE-family HTH domain